MSWIDKLSSEDIDELVRIAKRVLGPTAAVEPLDVVHDVLLKGLEEDFEAKAREKNLSVEKLAKSAVWFEALKAVGEKSKNIPVPETTLLGHTTGESARQQGLEGLAKSGGQTAAGRVSRKAWLREMVRLLDLSSIRQGERDFLVMAQHYPAPQPRKDRKVSPKKRCTYYMWLSHILAVLGSPKEPQYFTDEDRTFTSRWAHDMMFQATEILQYAHKPDRNRSLKKLMAYGEVLYQAAYSTARLLNAEWLPPAAREGAMPHERDAIRRVAGRCFVKALRLMLLSDPKLNKRFLVSYVTGKHVAPGRNGQGS